MDKNPGYAGVDNPLYEAANTEMMLGDALETVQKLLTELESEVVNVQQEVREESQIHKAEKVVIVPGYGMALAQAQHVVKKLIDRLEDKGKEVKVAIHPVAGRMPGHMNVLLAEAGVSYDKLYEMEVINEEFAETDLVIVVGANDVINPAAKTEEGTAIYGMPVLNVDEARNVIICNMDKNPGYAGVDNPLYEAANTEMMLGDALETVQKLLELLDSEK